MKKAENLEKYDDPKQYDDLHRNFLVDLNVVMEYAPKKGSTVIELACGTGRLTLPMAESGYRMVGVDLHEGMLGQAKEKAQAASLSIEFHQQDCTKLNLPENAPYMFMTGNSFQHFLTNEMQNQLFDSVKRHLEPGGIFIFDTRNPQLHELKAVDEYEEIYTDRQGRKVVEMNREVYDPVTQIQSCVATRTCEDAEGNVTSETDGIRLRYTFPLELERLLEQQGFELIERFGYWDKRTFEAGSPQMVMVCKFIDHPA